MVLKRGDSSHTGRGTTCQTFFQEPWSSLGNCFQVVSARPTLARGKSAEKSQNERGLI